MAAEVPGAGQVTLSRDQVLVLTSSLLTDRMLRYTGFLPTLCAAASCTIWATSAGSGAAGEGWRPPGATLTGFPEVAPFKHLPYQVLRRFNELVWDYRLRPPARMSMLRHVRSGYMPLYQQLLKGPAWLLALARGHRLLDGLVERLLLHSPRSPQASTRLREQRPVAVLSTGPHRFEEPAVVAAARRLGIPVFAFITSWDNLSTKNRMLCTYDGYIVWTERMKDELLVFHPAARRVPIKVVGAPQFDVFFQQQLHQSRAEFCTGQGLDPQRPIILHCLGSPYFLKEHHAALGMARAVAAGAFGDAQLLVRPHPLFDEGAEEQALRQLGTTATVQRTGRRGLQRQLRSQSEEEVVEWVNSFRHADVVVNLSSTVTVDAALCDRPVVNLDFDPEPGRARQTLVKEVNHRWPHFSPIAASGGVWLVNNEAEMVEAVKVYLEQPALHREGRRKVVRLVCGEADGRSGERMATALVELLHLSTGRAAVQEAAQATGEA